LKRELAEREYHIMSMESQIMLHARKFPNGEMNALQESLQFWQEKYQRLLEGHRKLQKVNQGLEDKLLRIADKFETEKTALTRDVADLTNKLVDARVSIADLEEESDQYRNDCNIAVQLLQCKPSNFVAHKFTTLPLDLQEKVRLQLNHRRTRSSPCNSPLNSSSNSIANNGAKVIRVPISTFPPTAMVYSIEKVNEEESTLPIATNGNLQNESNGCPDYVSAAIMAKVLEERSKERKYRRSMKCFQCRKRMKEYIDIETQTNNAALCYDDYHLNSYSTINRQRSESSSSIESFYNSNSSNFSRNTCNETIII